MNLWFSKINPMLAESSKPFDNANWIFEIKWDGTRCIAFVDKNSVRLQNRRLADITFRYPELKISEDINFKRVILDGEIVSLRNGKPDFERLQEREHIDNEVKIKLMSKRYPVVYIAFDILFLNGKNVFHKPLIERKKLLKDSVKESKRIIISEYIDTYGKKFFREVQKKGLEGVMAKNKRSKYLIGKRSKNWLKIKNTKTLDCVVCGYTKGEGWREKYFGSLILGCYRKNRMIYVGRVGTGFNEDFLRAMKEKFDKIQTNKEHFETEKDIEIVWIKPDYVAEVKFLEITKDLKLRSPSLVRIRKDKDPRECVI
jgi:bifunctional non-homologous end joining protein LigD